MARIDYSDPAKASPRTREILDKNRNANIFRMMAHAEANAIPLMRLGNSILHKQKLSAVNRELLILQAAQLEGGAYEWRQHVPIALGVALAQPKRRVVALEGDGSLLMQLGCLSTIATLAPDNLTMVVMDNGIYQITGSQPTPAASHTDIVAVALASGLANSTWAADEDDFERLIEQSKQAAGPTLIGVRIDDKPGTGTTRRDPVQIRERFMHGMGVRQLL